jgi:ATP-dependent exoDNAse (exonuclease V) beta subunit
MNESIYHDDYLKEKLQLWVDNLNLLYVAFTRPKNNLIVWCKDGHKNSVSQLLAEAIVGTSCVKQTIDNEGESDKPEDYIYQLGTVSPSIKKKNNSNTTNKLMIQPEGLPIHMESLETNIEFKQSNRSADFIKGEEDASGKYIRQGQLLHALFSCIHTKADISQALERLRMEGLIESHTHEEQIRKLTEWSLGHPMVKEWFSGKWKLYNECAIIYKENGELKTRRPDRVMMKDGNVIVVDFKFGNPKESHRKQVLEYMNLLTEMGYTHVRGYLWYVFNNELEEIK